MSDGTLKQPGTTYDGLTYISSADRMLAFGGGNSCNYGGILYRSLDILPEPAWLRIRVSGDWIQPKTVTQPARQRLASTNGRCPLSRFMIRQQNADVYHEKERVGDSFWIR